MSFQLLKALCETPAIPGREEIFRELVIKEISPYVDTVRVDKIGNVITCKKGSGKKPRKVMIAGHMDEIAHVVKYIDKDGFIFFHSLGGWDPRVMIAQRVKVWGRQMLHGVVGLKAPHVTPMEERGKVVPITSLFVDLGLPVKEVKKLVRIGDPITMDRDLIEMGTMVCGKTLDDRVGVYCMIESMKRLKKHSDDIYAVATVQEEIGVRGAKAATFGIDPDMGVALDITISADVPGVEERDHLTKLGHGVGIKILDGYSISDPRLVNFVRALAEKKKIKYQMEILTGGGTDAGGMQLSRAGIPVLTLSIPNRYTHSVVEMCHKTDIEDTIKLMTAFLEESGKFETEQS